MEKKETKQPDVFTAAAEPQTNVKEQTTSANAAVPASAAEPQQEVQMKKEDYTPERTAAALRKLPAEFQGIRNLFAQPWESFRAVFKDPAEADRIMQREITYAAEAMLANPYLISCAQKYPQEFIAALKNVPLSGLSLSPTLKQGYLVPFKGKVTFMPSYMGMRDLLSNNGHIRKIEAYAVFDGDHFEMQHGTEERLVHRPDPWGARTADRLLGCYWIAELSDGSKMFHNMTKPEIEVIKQRSPSVVGGKSSPWDTDYIEMAVKTCLRRGYKSLPKGAISEERMKVLEAVFDYDETVEQEWIRRKDKPRRYNFDDDAEFEDAHIINETTNG